MSNTIRTPLTVELPLELVQELRLLAAEQGTTLDEVVTQACRSYSEPYAWERDYQTWRQTHADACVPPFGANGGAATDAREREVR